MSIFCIFWFSIRNLLRISTGSNFGEKKFGIYGNKTKTKSHSILMTFLYIAVVSSWIVQNLLEYNSKFLYVLDRPFVSLSSYSIHGLANLNLFFLLLTELELSRYSSVTSKGQLISEWLWCLQFSKKPTQKFDEFLFSTQKTKNGLYQ